MVDITKIKELLSSLSPLAESGCAIAFHIRLTAPDFLFQTYPKEWTDLYSNRGYVMADPTVRWGFSETGSIRWSDLHDQDEQKIFEQSLAFGLNYGVSIATDTNNSRSFASFSRADREYNEAEIAQLTQTVEALHEITASNSGMDAALRDELTAVSAKMTRANAT